MRTFVGLHIPKCAGTSFLDMARDVLPAHQLFQNTSIIMNWNDGRPEFLDINDYAALRCEKTKRNFASFVALVAGFILAKSVHTAMLTLWKYTAGRSKCSIRLSAQQTRRARAIQWTEPRLNFADRPWRHIRRMSKII